MNIIYALLGAFSGLPTWTRWVFVVLSLAITLGLSRFFDSKVGIIITVGIVAVGCLVALLWAFVKKRREKRAAAFGGDLKQQSAATPGGISDPARRAALEDLRKNFEKGIETFRAAGKNLYDVPWYVIVGEPGAGKTEAIRHSEVGFPPGMQDEFQGVGGTINMNWWFTNDAVILDTAGRLLFEEVEAGSTSEWRIFLEMLKKHRPNCPINGLILAIPSESLVKDTPEQIQKKAGKIATQLETIQKKLDVRFPAYVVITKCDLLNGFREFFDNLTDPQAQHQMMGWSNPDPLDAPFRMDLVDDHIHTVVERLRRRRQGLMLDPVARAEQRRTDEVDRLFSLPHSVSLIAPNLRQYLQTIFIEGAWSVQPLFLRGIYFTSSLREGSALDQELASALGLDVESLPETRPWERESSFFLRDVFTEKTFKERGLVTRATNTSQLVMKRRMMLLGSSIAAGLLLLGFSLVRSQALKKSIGNEAGYWARATDFWDWQSSEDARNHHMLTPIVRNEEGKPMEYAGDKPVGPGTSKASDYFKDDELLLPDFHKALVDRAGIPLDVSSIFHFAKQEVDVDKDRPKAQRVVFENSVIKPLVDGTRKKMEPKLEASPAFEGKALVDLVRLEAAIVRRNEAGTVSREASPVPLTGSNFLPPLSLYTTGREPDKKLAELMDDLYSQNGAGARTWPPDWLSGGGSLSKNTAIESGLERFLKEANRVAKSQGNNFPLIDLLIKELTEYARKEDELASACHVQPNAPIDKVDALVLGTYETFKKNKETLDAALRRAGDAGLFGGGRISLVAAYEWINRDVEERYEIAKALLLEANQLKAANQSAVVKTVKTLVGKNQDYLLFSEIAEKIKDVTGLLETIHNKSLSADKLAELKTLDELHLTEAAGRIPHYVTRWELYQKALTASGKPPGYAATLDDIVGKEWKDLTDIYERVDQIRAEVDKYDGVLKAKTLEICTFCFARAKRQHSDEFCKAWAKKVEDRIGSELYFPFVWNPRNNRSLKSSETIRLGRFLDQMNRDVKSPITEQIQSPLRQLVRDAAKKYSVLTPIREALLTADGNVRLCVIKSVSEADQVRLAGQKRGVEAYQAVQLRAGDINHGATVKGATAQPVSTKPTSGSELGRFRLDEAFHFHFFKLPGDAKIEDDHPAPTEWTAFRLLDESTSSRIGESGRWYFELRMPNGTNIWFELEFEKPIPLIPDWPTRKKLGLE